MILLGVSGCRDTSKIEPQAIDNESEVQILEKNGQGEADKIIEICFDLYKKAEEVNQSADLEVIRSIIKRFGDNGYAAVYSSFQINMTEAGQVIRFCEKVDRMVE